MNVVSIARRLLSYFPPEMRSIPDAQEYPGPNAAVLLAINAALQEVATLGAPWFGFDERQVTLRMPATVTVQLTEDSATAYVETGWQAWMEGCAILIPGSLSSNRIRSAVEVPFGLTTRWELSLVGAHEGTTGPLACTIYHDAVSLGGDVVKLHSEVRLDGVPLTTTGDVRTDARRFPKVDFGFGETSPAAGKFSVGRPVQYSVERWRTGSTSEARQVVRLAPAPDSRRVLHLRVSVVPPEVCMLSSKDDLPVPFQFVETTFLPICMFHLQTCPWFQPPTGDLPSQYAAARASITDGNPAGAATPTISFLG